MLCVILQNFVYKFWKIYLKFEMFLKFWPAVYLQRTVMMYKLSTVTVWVDWYWASEETGQERFMLTTINLIENFHHFMNSDQS